MAVGLAALDPNGIPKVFCFKSLPKALSSPSALGWMSPVKVPGDPNLQVTVTHCSRAAFLSLYPASITPDSNPPSNILCH